MPYGRLALTAVIAAVGVFAPAGLARRSGPPLRVAVYYAWYPGWHTHYRPSLGYYSSDDPAVIRAHIAALRYGNFGGAAYSWWGIGSETDARFSSFLRASRRTPLRWAIYYEREGYADPSVGEIRTALRYLARRYFASGSYLRIGGRPVVFVYGDANDGCAMAARWKAADTVKAYVVHKVFHGYRACASQPDSWHQYGGAATGEDHQRGFSFTIMPGFYGAHEGEPRLPRDLERWRKNVRDMVASREPLQLVVSFNEWGEGTAVEGAREWRSSSGYGAYLDALHRIK